MNLTFIRVFLRKMSKIKTSLLMPIGVRGMKVLDRDKFLRKMEVLVLIVNKENVTKVAKLCKPYFLKLEAFRPIQNLVCGEQESSKKCIHFDPDKVLLWNDINESDRTALNQQGVTENNFSKKEIQLGYENWSYDTIFKAVLPEDEEIVSGFSQIGHIIHLNLRDHLLEYQQLIGQVLVDKIKTCQTVVRKSNSIDNTFRNFSMEVIAGHEDYFVTVKENRCIFQFDFAKVYWNPRLGKEHERILSFITPEDVLFDVFSGVGPFSIPAAKQKTKVFANDLNPDSFKWLNHNATKNKVDGSRFKSYNQDGKDFICNIFKTYLLKLWQVEEKIDGKIHITMNLPAMAVEFLKYFNGLLKDADNNNFYQEIIVYVYCFAVGDNPVELAKNMVIENIEYDISKDIVDVFEVRNVSPKKRMMRVTFQLTKEVLFNINDVEEPPHKKLCVDKQ